MDWKEFLIKSAVGIVFTGIAVAVGVVGGHFALKAIESALAKKGK